MEETIKIGGELESVATGKIVAAASAIKDKTKNKTQEQVNAETDAALEDRYTKAETYNKTQLDSMITTPETVYKDYDTYAEMEAETEHPNGAIYRVANYDGTQVVTNKYCEYSWDGAQYKLMAVRDHGIATAEDFDDPDNAKRAKLPTVGALADVYGYFVENPEWIYVLLDKDKRILAGIKSDGSVDWAIGVPTPVKEYVDNTIAEIKNGTEGTDIDGINKIITFLSDFSTSDTLKSLLDTKVDKEEGKSLIDADYAEGVHYAENPEFTNVWLDSEDKILFGVKTDGTVYFGAGVPPQIVDYIREKIEELSLDEYENIVAFLGDLIEGDKTLQELLNEKVDKEEGKSLIDEDYANGISYVENPEFAGVWIDSNNKILFGIQKDGNIFFGYGVPQQITDYIINIKTELETVIKSKVDKEEGKELIPSQYIREIENPEFRVVWLDNNEKILFGIQSNGNLYFGYGVPTQIIDFVNDVKAELEDIIDTKVDKEEGKSLINSEYAASQSVIEDIENRLEIKTDNDKKILSHRDVDGVLHENVGIVTPNMTSENSVFNKATVEEIVINGGSASLSSLTLTDEGLNEFQQDMKNSGFNFGGAGDWSDYISDDGKNPLVLSMPKIAFVNIEENIVSLNNLLKEGYPGAVEGVNYDVPSVVTVYTDSFSFKKKAYISGQGRGTMAYQKKNIAIDFFDDDFGGDALSIKFGNWVPQDSYHLKAYYEDGLRCKGVITYKLWDEMMKSRGPINDYYWKKALIDFNSITSTDTNASNISDLLSQFYTGAKCVPDGFPCIVYYKGTFWGIFVLQLKKHRDNYHLDKGTAEHIHLDGVLGDSWWNADGDASALNWDATDTWNGFEVRNPKPNDKPSKSYLFLQLDGTPYNPDTNAGEIMGTDSAYYDENNPKHVVCATAKTYILNATKIMPALTVLRTEYEEAQQEQKAEKLAALKNKFETHFDVDNLIDYLIFGDITNNWDGFSSNWQWITYDGIKWWCNLYDTNQTFGNMVLNGNLTPPITTHVCSRLMIPYIYDFYSTRLEARYKELRDKGIIDADHITRLFIDFVEAFPQEIYNKEYTKWSSAYIYDTIPRLYKWISEEISNMDTLYNYNV